ncbi:MAG: nicotinate phosphoribosyltransferase [Nitrososphaeraceae archaeon]
MEGLLISEYENLSSDIALATDFYELAMAAAYYYSNNYGVQENIKSAIFEMFVRKLPLNRSYIVAAGLEQALYFLSKIKFNDKHISYLRSLQTFKEVGEDFFGYLKQFKFTGTVWAVPEGTILFPNEPIVRIEAPIIEAQIVETYLLSTINFQTLIASKASRIVTAADGKAVIEFGSRRAHGPQAGLLAARASYIGGCVGTSNALAGYKLGIPVFGTMAHSYIMSFEKEEEAFKQFSKVFPSGFLLVDTYDSIAAVKKIIKLGIHTNGIRLDSGDLCYLSLESRKLLDNAAGYNDTKIMASGDLNEYLIRDLVNKGAPIDSFGVGTELSTSRDDPAMNGVYKLVAIRTYRTPEDNKKRKRRKQDDDILVYKLKTSPGKETYPGPKQIFRIMENKKIKKDFLKLEDEKQSRNDIGVPLLKKLFEGGKLLSKMPSIKEIQRYHLQQIDSLPTQFIDLDFEPKEFPVKYSKKLKTIKQEFKPR